MNQPFLVYKVVTVKDGKRVSGFVSGYPQVEYRTDQYVKGPRRTPLFVYRSLETAQAVPRLAAQEVWIAAAAGIRPLPPCRLTKLTSMSEAVFVRFWRSVRRGARHPRLRDVSSVQPYPVGTLAVNRVRLVARA